MKDRFREKPPFRLKLTKAQARKLSEAKPAGSDCLVFGYAARHPFPDNESHTLACWFLESEMAQEALIGGGIMSPPPKKKRAKRKAARKKKPSVLN